MRIIAIALLIFAALIQLLLGGLYLASAKNEKQSALASAGDLSSVAGDLASAEDLQKDATRAQAQTKGVGTRPLVQGIACFVIEALLIAGIVLVARPHSTRRTGGIVLSFAFAFLLLLTGLGWASHDGSFKVGALACAAVMLVLAYTFSRKPSLTTNEH